MNSLISLLCLLSVLVLSRAVYVSPDDMPDRLPYGGDMMARYWRVKQSQPQLDVDVDEQWPMDREKLENSGQVSGIDVDRYGNIHIFRRVSNPWRNGIFNAYMQYTKVKDGPIDEDTIVVMNNTGHIIRTWGRNMFYMPHGITVDNNLTTWLTDVATHQVYKFPRGAEKPSMIIGNKFEPGREEYTFCMPTDVAVDRDGNIFVSDGYCNSRIMIYNPNGIYLKQLEPGDNSVMDVPHSLMVIPRSGGDILCVSDRENKRVICYQGMRNYLPQTVRMFDTPGRVFSIDYSKNTIYGVTRNGGKSSGFTFDVLRWRFTGQWKLPKEIFAHDLAVSNGKTSGEIFVANINTRGRTEPVYKLRVNNNRV